MTPDVLQQIKSAVEQRFPGVTVTLDPPRDRANGHWYMDVDLGAQTVVVEYKRASVLGVSRTTGSKDDYGVTAPDHIADTWEIAVGLIERLLTEKK